MNYLLPDNWDPEIAKLVTKEEGGELVLSEEHYPVITKNIWIDAITERQRCLKWIIFSDKVVREKVYDRLDSLEKDFLSDTNEYKLAFIAFGNGCRIIEIRPLWSLCEMEE